MARNTEEAAYLAVLAFFFILLSFRVFIYECNTASRVAPRMTTSKRVA